MKWDVIEVKKIAPLVLQVKFQDGTIGKVRFENSHLTGVFEALKNPAIFDQVHIHNGAVAWPGDIDLAPDTMYAQIQSHGEWILR
ncbi:DUF2442 domain-containing protein [Polynucleobacter rarus]|uniref:DUF2442 domain-containing protein n=1 Tax=Polynucleobacter rarus TaxID=556055 RepID=UPI000D3E7D08|nr:DUF2442 domain-containing protein [Polynucleobacter rarus]